MPVLTNDVLLAMGRARGDADTRSELDRLRGSYCFGAYYKTFGWSGENEQIEEPAGEVEEAEKTRVQGGKLSKILGLVNGYTL